MNLSINPISFAADPKFLKKAGALKDGAKFELTVTSKAPKNCDIFYISTIDNKMNEILTKKIRTPETFDVSVPNFMKKLANVCNESDIVKEVSEFFASISK